MRVLTENNRTAKNGWLQQVVSAKGHETAPHKTHFTESINAPQFSYGVKNQDIIVTSPVP